CRWSACARRCNVSVAPAAELVRRRFAIAPAARMLRAMPRAVPASFALFVVALLPAQEPPANGPRRVDPSWIAWTGGTVIQKPGVRLERATLVARDGRIVSLDTAPPPAGATIVD